MTQQNQSEFTKALDEGGFEYSFYSKNHAN